MEHQYPGAISGDENMLAELMLPDQAHVRKQDWTIFFLHKDTSEEDDKEEGIEGVLKERQATDSTTSGIDGEIQKDASVNSATANGSRDQEEVEGGEGPPLIYVLNLVNTKQDASAPRFELRSIFDVPTSSDALVAEALLSRRWPYVQDIPFYISTR